MDPQQWQRIKTTFGRLVDAPTQSRAALLADLRESDPALHAEVASLLVAHEDSNTAFGDDGVAEGAETIGDPSGRRFGAYRVIKEIGRGGMGAVFLAERADGEFRRQVALKIVGRTFGDPDMARRLRRERQILASLNHPHIAHLLDGGVSELGEPFFVMELVEGVRIDEYCASRQLTTAQRLALFRDVCHAVAYAHEQQVIHRDLKPSNILVTSAGVPKLLDFGIARLLDESGGEHTITEYRAFTPEYASPEQQRGDRTLTPSTDVFSLGVLLQALLGEPAAAPRDLRTVMAMACRPEPDRRYASARALADDITRHLERRPVLARPDSASYRLATFAVRRSWTLVAACLVAAALLAGAYGATRYAADVRGKASATGGSASGSPVVAAPLGKVRTLAVLPLSAGSGVGVAASAMTSDQALRLGIAQAIATRLAEVRELTVRPTSATVSYLDQTYDAVSVGRTLQVDGIIDGTLHRAGGGLQTSLRLVDVASGAVLWTARLSSDLSGAVRRDGSLANRVMQRLLPGLAAGDAGQRRTAHVPAAAAQEAYLRGSLALATSVRQVGNIFSARDAFEQAIRLDPAFALAEAGLATSYAMAGSLNLLAPQDAYPRAERAARRALAMEADLAIAHVALADVEADYNWNWEAAEAAYRRAIELSPNVALSHQTYSEFLARVGRFTEASEHAARAQHLDPTRVNYVAIRALQLYLEHRFDEAIAQSRQALARDPNSLLAYLYLAVTHAALGDPEAGVAAGRKASALTGGAVPDQFVIALNAALMNDEAALAVALDKLHAFGRTRYVDPFHYVAIHAYHGDTEQAFAWLERSYAERSYWMTSLRVHPVVDSLRADPRFAALLRRMKLE